jgi:ArsR family transcriptional regulator
LNPVIPDSFLDLIAEKFRLLADSSRLAILRTLMSGEKTVGQVVDATGRNQANVSKHLKMLADAGMLSRRKEGLQVFYRLEDPLVEQLCKLVCSTIVDQAKDRVDQHQAIVNDWQSAGSKASDGF